ncbi:MAG: hypothetical protein JRF33_01130 [Deltaproteobacteria bacterium]|nr:hypothetical protein [Deltaproteobacteria bacterium]
MPFCPNCHDEYRKGFTRCAACDVHLVEQLPETMNLNEEAIAKAIEGKDLIPIARGPLDALRENKALLAQGRVASVIVPDDNAQAIPGAPKMMLLVVSQEEVEASAELLGKNFQNMVDQEGLGGQQDMSTEHCPACGTPMPADAEECSECGLFVGKG